MSSSLLRAARTARIARAVTVAFLLAGLLPSESTARQGTPGILYVTNSLQGKVMIVDTETYQVVSSIAVGGFPVGVGFTPDGTKAFVAHRWKSPTQNMEPSFASVIDVATHTVIKELPTGRYGFDAVVSRDGTQAFISDRDVDEDGSITEIDVGLLEVKRTLTLGSGLGFPSGMFISYDNAQLNVANQIDSSTVGMSLPAGQLVKFKFNERGAFDVAITENAVYVTIASPDSGIVKLIGPGRIKIPTGPLMTGIVALPDYSAVYAVRQVNPGELFRIDPVTDAVQGPIEICPNPWGITASDDSQFVYITCLNSGFVSVIETATNTVVATPHLGAGQMVGIAFTSHPAAPTDIERPPAETPATILLEQNFPNPFNPTTSIAYSLDNPGFVELVVFNLLGEKVQTLVRSVQSAGDYTVTFDARDLPSGVYEYHLTSGAQSVSRSMVVLK